MGYHLVGSLLLYQHEIMIVGYRYPFININNIIVMLVYRRVIMKIIQLSSHNLIHSPDVVSRVVLGRVQICLNQVYP